MNNSLSAIAARYSRTGIASFLLIAAVGLASSSATFADGHHFGLKKWFNNNDKGGVVYTMSNDLNNNEIMVFSRKRNGKLQPVPQATVATGGVGGSNNAAVDPLGSQNSLIFDSDTHMLFAVNAGDNTVSGFKAAQAGLKLRRTALAPSGGFIPVSLAVSEQRLYVLNAGGSGTVTTFAIGQHGDLSALGSLDLGQANGTTIPFGHVMAPGQVGVDALKRQLIVTNAGGQELLVAALDDDGVPVASLTSTTTPGIVPFAFDITPYGSVLVAEAGSGSVSAFGPPTSGQPLVVTSAAVATGQAASCWIVSHDNGFAYVANTGSDTISLFAYSRTGQLELVNATAGTAADAPTDMTLAGGGKFLYTLDAGSGDITGFAIDPDNGALNKVETRGGLPASAGIQGIAAFDY